MNSEVRPITRDDLVLDLAQEDFQGRVKYIAHKRSIGITGRTIARMETIHWELTNAERKAVAQNAAIHVRPATQINITLFKMPDGVTAKQVGYGTAIIGAGAGTALGLIVYGPLLLVGSFGLLGLLALINAIRDGSERAEAGGTHHHHYYYQRNQQGPE